jgi:acyl-CoA thioester hydrolase
VQRHSITSSDGRPTGAITRQGVTSLRVRYCECDPMGVAHHAAYVPWLEIARTELLRDSGVTYSELEARGVFLVITRLEAKYRRPAFYDDLLDVRVTWNDGSRVKIEHSYEVILRESAAGARAQARTPGDTLLVASTTLACVDAAGRIQPLPDWLAQV